MIQQQKIKEEIFFPIRLKSKCLQMIKKLINLKNRKIIIQINQSSSPI
jgi:hypothetical protein